MASIFLTSNGFFTDTIKAEFLSVQNQSSYFRNFYQRGASFLTRII
ncbi:Uncharacterised protein [Niallia circulans]|nr:Uncharacterised protein [Niallia circulans]